MSTESPSPLSWSPRSSSFSTSKPFSSWSTSLRPSCWRSVGKPKQNTILSSQLIIYAYCNSKSDYWVQSKCDTFLVNTSKYPIRSIHHFFLAYLILFCVNKTKWCVIAYYRIIHTANVSFPTTLIHLQRSLKYIRIISLIHSVKYRVFTFPFEQNPLKYFGNKKTQSNVKTNTKLTLVPKKKTATYYRKSFVRQISGRYSKSVWFITLQSDTVHRVYLFGNSFGQ